MRDTGALNRTPLLREGMACQQSVHRIHQGEREKPNGYRANGQRVGSNLSRSSLRP
jgi:hypothetical protein